MTGLARTWDGRRTISRGIIHATRSTLSIVQDGEMTETMPNGAVVHSYSPPPAPTKAFTDFLANKRAGLFCSPARNAKDRASVLLTDPYRGNPATPHAKIGRFPATPRSRLLSCCLAAQGRSQGTAPI